MSSSWVCMCWEKETQREKRTPQTNRSAENFLFFKHTEHKWKRNSWSERLEWINFGVRLKFLIPLPLELERTLSHHPECVCVEERKGKKKSEDGEEKAKRKSKEEKWGGVGISDVLLPADTGTKKKESPTSERPEWFNQRQTQIFFPIADSQLGTEPIVITPCDQCVGWSETWWEDRKEESTVRKKKKKQKQKTSDVGNWGWRECECVLDTHTSTKKKDPMDRSMSDSVRLLHYWRAVGVWNPKSSHYVCVCVLDWGEKKRYSGKRTERSRKKKRRKVGKIRLETNKILLRLSLQHPQTQ